MVESFYQFWVFIPNIVHKFIQINVRDIIVIKIELWFAQTFFFLLLDQDGDYHIHVELMF